MSKGHTDLKPPGASQRRLNIIYFIDSAKTRSISIPLGRLNLLLALIFLVFSWAFASIFVIAWFGEKQLALSTRLKSSLATIFEYQSRFDNVYELAYPPATPSPDSGQDPAPPGLRAEEYAESIPSESSHSQPTAVVGALAHSQGAALPTPETAVPQESRGQSAGPGTSQLPSNPVSATSQNAQAAQVPAPGDIGESKGASVGTGDVLVTVGNTTLEKGSNGVALHFELANRSTRTRAEGYIWAIAEFVGDDGQKYFIGAPRELKLNANGDPTNPEKATYFGIKRFKKQSFNFPMVKGRSGTFKAVRIGIMDLSGEGRRSYRLSTEVRVR
jgi:hypothetical protein